MKRVVITGVGILAPSGAGKEEFWRNNTAGVGRLTHEPLMEEIGLRSRVVSRLPAFDLASHHDPADLPWFSRLSRFAQFGVTVGSMVAGDAGLPRGGPPPGVDPDRAGVVFSSAIGGTPEFQESYEELSDLGAHPITAFPEDSVFYDSVFLNYAPAWTARTFGLRGPCTSLTTGCTAGIDALGLGFDLVRHGDLDMVISAAAEAPLSGLAYATLDVIGSLAVGDWPAEQASRPFDARRGGFVLGEGAAALVLEEMTSAVARGARIYGEVLGYSSQNNAKHMTDLEPDGVAMASVLRGVLSVAQEAPHVIDYVNAHGSSTPQNDVFETQALKDVMGDHAYRIPVSSTKSMIGHSLSAASLTGVVATLGAFETGIVPPTMNYEFPDPECDLDYVPGVGRRHESRTALVMASGFGGIHSGALLRAPRDPRAGLTPRPIRPRVAPPGPVGAESRSTAADGPLETPPTTPARSTAADGPSAAGANGTRVLFLHGFGGTAEHWGPLVAQLPEIEAYAVDLPGHGSNRDTPLDLTGRALDAALADLAAELGGADGLVVVGHSLGALVAARLAAVAPQRVRGLVLLTSGVPFRVHPGVAEQLQAGGGLDAEFLAGCLQRPSDAEATRLVGDGFARMRPVGDATSVWGVDIGGGAPGQVRAPTLVVLADEDVVTSPRRGRALAAALPDAELITLPGAGHYAHIEDAPAVAAAMQNFLRRIRPGAAT